MKKRKKIIIILIVFITLSFFWYFGIGLFDYLEIVKIKQTMASGGCPGMDGGKISMVREMCVLDTPVVSPTTCAISCPGATTAWGPACINYIEIDTVGQLGTVFITPPKAFKYSGGGVRPMAGMDFLYCGASNSIPWAIGIPSRAVSRTQKLVDAYKFIIAGFKKE